MGIDIFHQLVYKIIYGLFKITIDKTKVSGSLTNYVYVFTEGCSNIPAHFWTGVIDVNGLDIKFYDSDDATELKRTIVVYDSSGQKVEVHVKIPSIDSGTDKVLWCHYGNTTRQTISTYLLLLIDIILFKLLHQLIMSKYKFWIRNKQYC